MDALRLAAIALFISFWIVIWLRYRGLRGRVSVYPFLVIIRAGLSRDPLPEGRLRAFLSLSGWIALISMLILIPIFYYYSVRVFWNRYIAGADEQASQGAIPLIPGVTIPFEDLPYILVSIGIAALFHELAHAFVARAEGIKVKDAGFALLAFIPAAFVEPEEKSLRAAKLISRLKVYSAGVTVNLLIFGLAFLALSSVASGVLVESVVQGSPADKAGLKPGMVIVGVEGESVKTVAELAGALRSIGAWDAGSDIRFTLRVREGEDLREIVVHKPPGEDRIGISISQYYRLPVEALGPLLLSLLIINLGIAVINAAPIAIPLPGAVILTDGGHIVADIAEAIGGKAFRSVGVIVGIVTLLLVLSILTFTPITVTP